jgi:hypothetical protein
MLPVHIQLVQRRTDSGTATLLEQIAGGQPPLTIRFSSV